MTAGPPRKLRSYLGSYRLRAAIGFLCVAGAIGTGLTLPLILRYAIDELTAGGVDIRRFLRFPAWYLLIGVSATGFAIGMRRLLLGLAHLVEYDIRRDVFSQLTRMDADFFQRERTGDIMTKMTSDLSAVREFIGQGLLQGARILAGFPAAFGIMLSINVRLALCIAALIPVISVVFFVLVGLIRKHYDRVQEQFSAITAFAQENFSGFRTVKGFGIEERQKSRFKQLNDEYIRRNMILARIEEPVWPFMLFMFALAQALLLWYGGRLVVQREITLGEFIQFQQCMIFLHWPMLALGWTINLLQRGRTSWQRLKTILETQPDIRDTQTTDASISEVRGAIEFRRVSLRRGERTLLHEIDLAIPEGQALAITGPTGSGKTLLASLIVRLMDASEGCVLIGGRDVRAFPLDVLRRDIGIAPQEPFLFSDTLANNIALGLAETRIADVVRAAEIAHLRGEVDHFPLQFETMLGERGVTLSGGQRQRTAISRALARQPRILILDDVFSAVDTQTEARILEQLLPALRGRTSILISHRVSTLRNADRILVMDFGRIVQDGTHEELTARPGYYRDLDVLQRLQANLEAR